MDSPATATTTRVNRPRLSFLAASAVFVASALLGTCCVKPAGGLTSLSATEFESTFSLDRDRYQDLDRQMETAVAFLEKRQDIFSGEVLTPEQEKALLTSWASFWDCAFALDQVRVLYEDWYRFAPAGESRSRHLRSFLLTFAAELALYEKSSRLARLFDKNPNAIKFLDAGHPDCNIPAGSFCTMRSEFQGHRDLSRVTAGEAYLRLIENTSGAKSELGRLGCAGLWKRVESHLAAVHAASGGKRLASSTTSDFGVIKSALRRAWFPAQRSVAEWMGDAKVRRHGVYLISDAQLETLRGQLRPGDVLLARKNWYMSNVALPGFWPHAAIYVGSCQQVDTEFDCPEVRAWIKAECGEELPLSSFLAKRFPKAAADWKSTRHDRALPVMEAVSEGIQFSSMHEVGGDYLAALRPKLDKLARARALADAFGHHGKPYDFDFDFATDTALVCTELVWRSYRPAEGKAGLTMPLVDVMGRRTLPANEVAALFASEHGKPGAQFDFVAFIDGQEKTCTAFVSTEDEFLKTPKRAKWDIMMK